MSANSIGSLMGFTADKFFAANTRHVRESGTTASLDRTISVLIQTSLCSGSIVAGKGGQSALAMIHLAAFSRHTLPRPPARLSLRLNPSTVHRRVYHLNQQERETLLLKHFTFLLNSFERGLASFFPVRKPESFEHLRTLGWYFGIRRSH